jgi:hypothetical protein
MSSSVAFTLQPSRLRNRNVDRIARAAAKGLAVAYEDDGSGGGGGGGGDLGDDIVVIPKGGPIVPPEAFRDGDITSTGSYFCFGRLTYAGVTSSYLLNVNLATGAASVTELPAPLNAFNVQNATISNNQFVVASLNETFPDGAPIAIPFLNLAGSIGTAVGAAPPLSIPAGIYAGKGTVGADGAVYFMPASSAPAVMRVDPVASTVTFIALPGSMTVGSFGRAALHVPSGHLIAFPKDLTSGKILRINTSVSPPTASWVQGYTQIYNHYKQPVEMIGSSTGELADLVTISGEESSSSLFVASVYNVAADVVVGVPDYGLRNLGLLVYEPEGRSVLHRFPMTVAHSGDDSGSDQFVGGFYNAARESVILMPDELPQVVEIRGSGPSTVEQNVLLVVNDDDGGPKFVSGHVFNGLVHMFPFDTISCRILQLPANLDPTAKNIISFYGY